MTQTMPPAGWYQDPAGQAEARYWNGTVWTDSVLRGGAPAEIPLDPERATLPPLAGTEISASTAPMPMPMPAAQRTGPGGMLVGAIGFAIALIVVILVVVAVTGGDSSDDPPPGTDAPPADDAPAPGETSNDG